MLSYLQRLFAQEFILAVLSEAIVEKEKKNTGCSLHHLLVNVYLGRHYGKPTVPVKLFASDCLGN